MLQGNNYSNAVSKYLDLEAGVQDESDESDNSDNEQEKLNQFVVADESTDHEGLTDVRLYRWDDLDQWSDSEQSPAFLENLAQDIKIRYRTRHGSNESPSTDDHRIAHLPRDCDSIWRVKVQIGLERDTIVEILQKCLRSTSIFEIKSAFCRDAIKGWIYVESKSVATIYNILDGVHGPMRHRGRYNVRLVDIHDQHLLLDMDIAGAAPPIKVNSWVRIKRGMYRGDLGLVKFVAQPTFICDTYVVPRIPMTLDRKRKRGHRTPQLLFDPNAIQEIYGPGAADKRNRVYLFQGEAYTDGLLCREIHMTDLSIEGVNATPEELEPFRQSSEIWNEADALISPIKVGDWVRVVSGTFVGMVGEITEVLNMTVRIAVKKTIGNWENIESVLSNDAMAIQPTWEEAQKDTREILTRDVRKAFKVGDLVQIVRGRDRGLDGFLVRLEADSAVIYVLPTRQGNSLKDGREINIKVADVEWKSNPSHFFDATLMTSDIPSGRTRYDPAHPEGLPYVAPDPSLELNKRTAERYKHMEVRILKGDAKRHFGVVKGTHKSPEGEELIDVLTSTRVTNSLGIYHIKDLQERFTKLPIDKACWIPVRFRNAKLFELNTSTASRPSTPLGSPGLNSESSLMVGYAEAWDPRARTPEPVVASKEPEPVASISGRWLLDERLLFRKLDVRVQGTTSTDPPWQSGKFEGQLGFVVLTGKAQSVQASTIVKTGFAENRALLQIRHLVPEHSMEVPTYRTANAVPSASIFSTSGCRVVIIGPDIEGCLDYIGNYALVASVTYTLPPSHSAVQIASPGPYWGKYVYLDISSVCRSLSVSGPIDWFGTIVD